MLDRLLKWGVDYLLKDYVIIDPNQAKTNILEGKIEFENLELRPDLLQKLGVPGYSLRAGHIGKLLVHISPWHYATEPGNVTIDGIYLLIVPSHAIKVDKKTKAENKVQDKLRTLSKIEEMRAQKLNDDPSDSQSQKESKDGFILRQVMAIVRNLQISISNIHIRLEDASTDPTCKVSLGLSLDSLTLNTCSSNWEERLVTESSDVFFKVAKLRSLAMYFTTHSKLYSELAAADSKSLKVVLRSTIARESGKLPPAFHYILKPLSSDAKVWIVPNPKRCKSGQAQFFLDMVVHDVAILASKQQVHCAIALAESTDLLRMKNKYKKLRPADMSSPTVKWKFALKCILLKTIRPKRDVWKWENIKWHRETFKKYRAIMEKTYSYSNYKLTEIESVEKRIAEEKLDVFNLDLARRLAQQTVKLTKEALAKEQKKKKGGGWFSSWYGSGRSESSKKAAAVEESIMLEIESSMEDTQNKAELYKALGVDDSDDSFAGNYSLLPKNFIQLEVGVALTKFSINFVDLRMGDITQSVCKVSVHHFKTSLWRQPVTNYVKVKVDLGKLDVEGTLPPGQYPKTSEAPALVSMTEQNSRSSLATVVFELHPLSMPTVDFYVQVRSQSLQVIYDILTVQSLVDYFKTKQEATLVADDVKDVASRQMKKFNNTSAAGVIFLLEKHKAIFVDVDLEPSFALIPSIGKIDPNEPVVILKTGHLKVVTKNKSHFGKSVSSATSKSMITRSSTFDELKEKPYDSFECTLSEVQLFYLHRSVNWQQIAVNPDSSESLVKPIKLTLDIHKCLVSDDPEFPLIKLNGALEDLAVIISDITMIRLMKFLKDMKFPKTSSSNYVQSSQGKNMAPSLQYGKRGAIDSLDEINQIDNFLPLASEVEKEKRKDESPTKQLTLVKLDYTIQRVAILLLEDGSLPAGVTNRFLSAELKNLSINLLKKTYEIPVTLSLESVSLIHQRFNYENAPLRLLETKTAGSNEKDTLVMIRIRIAERNSRVFHTDYESVEFLVEAVVQSVRIRLHQEAILSAMTFQQNLMGRMFPEEPEAMQSSDVTVIEVPSETQPAVESMEIIDRYNKKLARERKTKLVLLRLFASLKETDVLVSSQKISHDLADIKLKTMQTFVEVVPSETVKFTASLEYFKIKDPFKETMYPDILSVRGSQVFSLDVTYFFSATKGDGYADMEKSDLMCKLKTGTPRVVYIHRWVDSALQFLSHFQAAQQKLKDVGSSAARGTADLANIVHEKAFRIKLDLEISAPFVVIPQNSHSTHVLYANLGHLNVKNMFQKIDVESQLAVLDSMNVKLDDVKVTRALIDDKGYVAAECHLLEPSVMSIDVIRNLTPKLYKEQSGIEINGKITNLTTSVGQADIQLVYEILLGNFGEVKPKPAAAPKKRKSSISRGRSHHKKGASSRGSSVQSRGDGNLSIASTADESFVESDKVVEKLVTLKASFEIQSVCAQLFSDRIKLEKGLATRDMNASLGKFELISLRVNTTMHSDGDMVFHADMVNCTLDDTRTVNNSSIVRMIERKHSDGKDHGSRSVRRTRDSEDMAEGRFSDRQELLMISFDYAKEGGKEERIELQVNNMYICVCTDFLMSIADFFLKNRPSMPANETEERANEAEKALTAPLDTIQEEPNDVSSDEAQASIAKVAVSDETAGSCVTRIISVSFQDPEIVLVSDTREDSSPCLILTWKVQSSLVMRPMELKVTALIKDIEMLCCPFKHSLRVGNTKQVVLAFTIHAFATQSQNSNQQNMSIEVDPVEINISPAVIKVIKAVADAMSMHQSISDGVEVYGVTDALWAPKFICDEDIAFLKSPVVQSASKISAVDSQPEMVSSESAFLEAPKIVIKFDISDSTGITQPIILLQSSLSMRIENYISRDRLQIGADFSIGMNYFNDLVNAWEPVIEPKTDVSDKGQLKSKFWTIRAEIARGGVNTESSVGDAVASDWLVELSAPHSMEVTVTSRFLYSLNVIKEAFTGSFEYVNDNHSAGLYGDMAPYAIVNASGRDLAVLIAKDFTTKGRGTSVSDDGTSLVTLAPQDKIELVPNSNMSAAQYRRLTSKSSFTRSTSIEPSFGSNEEEFAQVAFDIIVPGSETLRDVSLTKPGYHFYNILPLSEYRFSLVVRNALDDTGHQNVCTISSSLILSNEFDIPFDVFYDREKLGSMQPGKKFHVPMLQAFHPGESRLFIMPTLDESGVAKWGLCSKAIDWRTLKKSGNERRFLINQCPPVPQPSGFAVLNPLKMILKLGNLKLGTIHGELRDTPRYVIHVKPTCVIRNLSPYPIYYRFKVTDGTAPRPYTMLMYGQQELIYEAELGVTKIDIDITDHRDIRFIGCMTLRKQGKPITHGQWFDSDKRESLVMGLCWTYDETDFLIMSIFAPYWIVNRLDRDLFLKRADDERVMTHPANFQGISLFTPSAKDNVDKVKMCIRVDNTLFSEPLNIQAVGNAEIASCPRRNGGDLLVGVTNTLSRMRLSKIIVLTPNYILLNNTKYVMDYAQFFPTQVENQEWALLKESAVLGIWPSINPQDADKKSIYLILRYKQYKSMPFLITRSDDFLLRVAQIGCLHISVSVSENATTITVNTYFPGAAPAKLFNLTDRPVLYWQNTENQMWSQKTYVLTSGNHGLFTWPDPTAQRALYYKIEGQVFKNGKSEEEEGSRFDLTKDTFQEVVCDCSYNSGEKSKKYYVSSMLCRQQRVLVFTDDHCLATGTKEQQLHEKFSYDVILSLYGFGLSLINNTINKQVPKEIFYAGITPTEVTWMYYGKGKKHWVPFSVNNNTKIEQDYQKYLQKVKGGLQPMPEKLKLGSWDHVFDYSKKPMLLIAPDPRKVKRTYMHGIFIQYQQSPNVTHFQFKMNRLQIDDPLPTCMFPVVFAPVPPPKSIAGDREPIAFIQATIVMQRGSGQLILFKYAKVLIQEFSIKVDTTFLGALQSFFSGNEIKTDDFTDEKYLALDLELADTPLNKTEAVQVACDTLRHYYQDLNLGPIKLLLSLSLAKGENDSGLLGINNSFVDGLAQTFGVVLTEQHDTCIKLAYFERKNRFLTFNQLTNQAKKFYTNQIVRQFYYFFTNLDAMGNPQKLLLGIKEGGTDLFYEPYQGAILGPAEFVEGLGIGVKSLGSHAIGGVFGVASTVTASAGQAIAFLTFDEKHKQERRNDMREKPQHVGQGLTKGFKRLGSGVFGGVTGVITQPIQGVKKDGAKGLVTGIGKGAAGLVAKPVGGVFDLASNTFEGIKGSADTEVAVSLLRTPRVVRCDHIVRAYDEYEAKGNAILKELQRPLMRYSGHVFTKKDRKGVVIVTQKALVHAEKKALVAGAFEKWDILTIFFFRDVVTFPEIQLDDDKFFIEMKGDKKGETRTKTVTVQAACKKFLRDRAIQSFLEFCKRQKSND